MKYIDKHKIYAHIYICVCVCVGYTYEYNVLCIYYSLLSKTIVLFAYTFFRTLNYIHIIHSTVFLFNDTSTFRVQSEGRDH